MSLHGEIHSGVEYKNAANGQQSALKYVYDIGQKQSIGSKTVNRVKHAHRVKKIPQGQKRP